MMLKRLAIAAASVAAIAAGCSEGAGATPTAAITPATPTPTAAAAQPTASPTAVSMPFTPGPDATTLPPDLTPKGVMSPEQAKSRAVELLSVAAHEVNVVQGPRNAVAELTYWGDFARRYASDVNFGPEAAPYDQMVWFVEAEGEWRSGGIVPQGSRTTYRYASVALDAKNGTLMHRSHYNEPKLIGQ
ncbi:MAG: hypothetical protein FJ319_05575 [SAR202 cluster bacterium]|nr:hypothetical protein [SAR202 cluster bacterium]